MNAFIRGVFLSEAVTQCEYALHAASALQQALAQMGAVHVKAARGELVDGQDPHAVVTFLGSELFRNVHSLLTHASNVSRLFWPSKVRRRKDETDEAFAVRMRPTVRAIALRASAGIPEQHTLRSRTLRDHLEHFDERIDHWAATSEGHNFLQGLIGANPFNNPGMFPAGDYMRWYDTSGHVMRFRGEAYPVQPLITALEGMHQQCKAAEEREDEALIAEKRAARLSAETRTPEGATENL